MKQMTSERAMKLLKKLFPYYMLLMAVFLLVPLAAWYSDKEEVAQLVILWCLTKINPTAAFFTAFVFGLRNGFTWGYPISVAVVSLLAMLFYYFSSSYLIFAAMCVLLALAGCWLGSSFKRHRDEMYL